MLFCSFVCRFLDASKSKEHIPYADSRISFTKSPRVSQNNYFCRYDCFFAARDGFFKKKLREREREREKKRKERE